MQKKRRRKSHAWAPLRTGGFLDPLNQLDLGLRTPAAFKKRRQNCFHVFTKKKFVNF
jgi:hypothetical protein